MKTRAAIVLAIVLGTGCAHAGIPAASTIETSISHVEVAGQTVTSSCSEASMVTHFFWGAEGVEKRVIERKRCGVVELRVVDMLDVESDTRVREILGDRDHDGEFERRVVERFQLEGSFASLAHAGREPS
jgi:hypothetical protein